MKPPRISLSACALTGALLLVNPEVTAQEVQPFQLLLMGWDGPGVSRASLVTLPADAPETPASPNAPLRVILTRAEALPHLPASTSEEMRLLVREGVPLVCRGADRELAEHLGCQVVDITDESRRGSELVALRYQDGLWRRAYFIPWEGMAPFTQGTGEEQDELLTKALAWVAQTATRHRGVDGADGRARGGAQLQGPGDATGAGWNGIARVEWHYTATYGTTKLGDYWVSVTPYKLRDNRRDADWYLVENSIEHAEIRGYLCTGNQRGWYVTTHQLSLQTLDKVTALEEHAPGTTEGQQSVSISIGGELGSSLEGPAAGLNTSFTRTYSIPDVSLHNRCDRSVPEARWDADYRLITFKGWPFCTWDDCPPATAHLTHATKQACIWRTPADGPGTGAITFRLFSLLNYAVETVDPWLFGCRYDKVEVPQLDMRDVSLFRNFPPETPRKPSLPSPVQVGLAVEAETSSIDPDGNAVRFQFDWGDRQGEYGQAVQSHFYTQAGSFNVRVKAMDTYGEESAWSDSFAVTVIGQPPAAPLITTCSVLTNGLLSLRAAGTAGMTYTLQTSTDLVNWDSPLTVVAGPDGSIQYQSPYAPIGLAGYFRLRWP